jgi:hypothetical protein
MITSIYKIATRSEEGGVCERIKERREGESSKEKPSSGKKRSFLLYQFLIKYFYCKSVVFIPIPRIQTFSFTQASINLKLKLNVRKAL